MQIPVAPNCEKGTPVDFDKCLETFLADNVVDDLMCNTCGSKQTFIERKRFITFPTCLVVVLFREVMDNWVPKKLEVELQMPGALEGNVPINFKAF